MEGPDDEDLNDVLSVNKAPRREIGNKLAEWQGSSNNSLTTCPNRVNKILYRNLVTEPI